MIRLFDKQAAQVLCLLTNLKRHVGNMLVGEAASDYYNGNAKSLYTNQDSQLQDRIYRTAKNHISDPTSLDDVITELTNIVHTARTEGSQKDLIDEIARLLQMPRASFVFGSTTLKAPQTALLIPEELRNFKAAVRSAFACNGCGNTIRPGEMVSLQQTDDGTPYVYCLNCRNPSYIPCKYCHEPTPLQSWSRSKTYLCGQCQEKEKVANGKKQESLKSAATAFDDGPTLSTAPDDGAVYFTVPSNRLATSSSNLRVSPRNRIISQRLVNDLSRMQAQQNQAALDWARIIASDGRGALPTSKTDTATTTATPPAPAPFRSDDLDA